MKMRSLPIWTPTITGGIKKYQWVTLPLALHGVVVKKDGTVIEVNNRRKE